MIPDENTLKALRDALAVSPENVPLRRHLADTLRALGRREEAEKEYRLALQKAREDTGIKLALAACYFESGKDSHALVILDSVMMREDLPATAQLLRARLLLRQGEIEEARRAYGRAVASDKRLADAELEASLREPAKARSDAPDEGVVKQKQLPGRAKLAARASEEARSVASERPTITFADIGGMQSVKDDVAIKIIQPMKHPELFQTYGKTIGGGILMYGPPGCGKTLLARATAGEVKANFFSIGIHDVLEKWFGQSERNLHAIFEEARRKKPSVLFFDEIDALGVRRTEVGPGWSGMRLVVDQFLAELDGAKYSNEGVLVLAATNVPWHVDSALRRPGRFDRIVFVPPPDEESRAAILRVHLAGKPQETIDFAKLAARTPEFSGADLRLVVDRAVEERLRSALAAGKAEAITEADLLGAAGTVTPSTREWFGTARALARFATRGGFYSDIAKYLRGRSST
jgi:SpoVK/Ycf46/Vps4 family AAA+-type ATPase